MRTILAIIFMTFATQASAEPSSDIRLLMERPITLLEWGMYKMRLDIDEFGNPNDDIIDVSYDWDQNRIYIRKWIIKDRYSISFMEQAKSICKLEFIFFDNRMQIRDGKNVIPEYCSACDYFKHRGFSLKPVTEAAEKLQERFYYSLSVDGYICERKVYGTSISVSKN